MKEIEADGFITSDNDVYNRLRADANYNWKSVITCDKCIWSMDYEGDLYCWFKSKFVNSDDWCTYGGK